MRMFVAYINKLQATLKNDSSKHEQTEMTNKNL